MNTFNLSRSGHAALGALLCGLTLGCAGDDSFDSGELVAGVEPTLPEGKADGAFTGALSVGGREDGVADILFQQSEGIGWPPRPWLRIQAQRSTQTDATLTVGLKVSAFGVDAGVTNNTTFTASRVTSAVFITHHSENGQTMLRRADNDVQFNDTGHPIIGFCLYDTSLSVSDKVAATLMAHGNGVSGSAEIKDLVNAGNNSQFFVVDPVKSPNYYLSTVCEEEYNSRIREGAEQDLYNLAYDIFVYSNPQDSCVPASSDVPRDPKGDPSCMAWHRQLLPGLVAHTVPRCVANSQGNHRCQMRSKKDYSCPLYADDDTDIVYTTWKDGRRRVTSGSFEYACDPDLGLRCHIVQEEWWPFRAAKGECK